ncbi:hypothetical protein [Rhodoplanes sp. Z2-YC6860]|uniref:hypothetical protein n=1 Tax=Rhodoplanes sp. Z2-YC6860 TaxID=674703 RepID=UPI00078BEDDC|nr:hypothetical protein [Rhodoplanes sp. Z2-YC6860]AMN43668.1 hypothetical protein RHPLAN_52460 [Rhodoplanes sp. Z2-YC6860]
MIKLVTANHGGIINVHIKGRQSALEFGEAGGTFAKQYAGLMRLLVLFDWSALAGWDDNDAACAACRKWQEAARAIDRAAIVHEHCWNRQAAVMGAVLRLNRVSVRSWAVADCTKAAAWLDAAGTKVANRSKNGSR